MKKGKYLLFASLLYFVSCSNNSEDDLTEPIVLGTTTYINNVKSIIETNCISCHGTLPSNGASVPLVTYAQVKNAVLTNGLLDRVSRAQGSNGMMPSQGTRLPQSTINVFIDWNADGLLE